MNRSISLLVLIGLALASLTVGYGIRVLTHSSSEATEDAHSIASSKSLRSRSSWSANSHAFRTQRALKESSGSLHWLQWVAGVDNASLDELPDLARLAAQNETAFQIIAHTWLERDPQHFFATLQTKSRELTEDHPAGAFPYHKLLRFLFREWPKRDLGAAITALSNDESLLGLSGMRHNVFNMSMEIDPKRGLEVMKEWDIRNHGPGTRKLSQWARKDPRAAAEAVLANPSGYGSKYCMDAVAKVWAKLDPKAALDFASQAQGEDVWVLQKSVFSKWLSQDREAAADWLATQEDPGMIDHYRPMLIESWAKDDPQEALTWCRDHLSGKRLDSAIVSLVQGAASKDLSATGELVKTLESTRQRELAAAAVAKKWFPDNPFSPKTAISSDAVAWLKTLDSASLKSALNEVKYTWVNHDLEGFRDFLTENEDRNLPGDAYFQVALGLTRKDPLAAIEWASGLPPERAVKNARNIFNAWHHLQPAKATEWMISLPLDDARLSPILKSFVHGSAHLSETQIQQRFQDLPPEFRVQAREELSKIRLKPETREKVEKHLR